MTNNCSHSMRGATEIAPDPSHDAASLIIEAARSLIDDTAVVVDRGHCRAVAQALASSLARGDACRADILAVSPSIVERSGRVKTLVEMVEEDGGDRAARLRLARLLLRAIDWR
jgi:hypothetical protein